MHNVLAYNECKTNWNGPTAVSDVFNHKTTDPSKNKHYWRENKDVAYK